MFDALTNRVTGRVIDGGKQTQFSGWFLGFLHGCIFERTGTRRWQSGFGLATDKSGCGAKVRTLTINKQGADDEKSVRRRANGQNCRPSWTRASCTMDYGRETSFLSQKSGLLSALKSTHEGSAQLGFELGKAR